MKKITIPKIIFPGISQEDFDAAFDVLDSCLFNKEVLGHKAPFFSPGGSYGECWWSLDEALILSGYKWLNHKQAAKIFLNLASTQTANGRIKLYGNDFVSHIDIKNRMSEVGSLPKFFETGYTLCRQSVDSDFISAVYTMFSRNLHWWFNYRQDRETNLISALFEETFRPYLYGDIYEYAPMDTNIQISLGCAYTAELAALLGMEKEAAFYRSKQAEIITAVNRYLWDEDDGVYYPYLLKERKRQKILLASMFTGFISAKTDVLKKTQLMRILNDDSYFNWDHIPLTSVSKRDREFIITTGKYQGNPSWSGNVWTLLNEAVIYALVEAGEKKTAAELALKTVRAFNGNYTEFINPRDGSGHGVMEYGWTASQYIQIIIEYIFGIDYNARENKITIEPLLSDKLHGEKISLENLSLPDGRIISVNIDYSENVIKISQTISLLGV